MSWRVNKLIKRAKALRANNEWAQAESTIDQAIQIEPRSHIALILKCTIHYERGKCTQFDFLSESQRKLVHQKPSFHYLKGSIAFKGYQFKEASTSLEKAIELCVDDYDRFEYYSYLLGAYIGEEKINKYEAQLKDCLIRFDRLKPYAFSAHRVRRLLFFAAKLNLIDQIYVLLNRVLVIDYFESKLAKARREGNRSKSNLLSFNEISKVEKCLLFNKPTNGIRKKAITLYLPPNFSQQVMTGERFILKLYQNILVVLNKIGIPVITKNQYYGNISIADPSTPSLSWHTLGKSKNLRHLKEAYLPGYFYFDRCGYSGWAEITDWTDSIIEKKLERIELNSALDHRNLLYETFFTSRKSKYAQTSEKFTLEQPYLFVALQVSDDYVSNLTDWNGIRLVKWLIHSLKHSKYRIVIKRHPKCRSHLIDNFLDEVAGNDLTHITEASIHDLIVGAEAVFTINSGVGFESLIAGKPVFVASQVDYHYLTFDVRTISNEDELIQLIKHPVDIEKYSKFLFYFTKNYLIQCDDVASLSHHLQSFLKESNSNKADFSHEK